MPPLNTVGTTSTSKIINFLSDDDYNETKTSNNSQTTPKPSINNNNNEYEIILNGKSVEEEIVDKKRQLELYNLIIAIVDAHHNVWTNNITKYYKRETTRDNIKKVIHIDNPNDSQESIRLQLWAQLAQFINNDITSIVDFAKSIPSN